MFRKLQIEKAGYLASALSLFRCSKFSGFNDQKQSVSKRFPKCSAPDLQPLQLREGIGLV